MWWDMFGSSGWVSAECVETWKFPGTETTWMEERWIILEVEPRDLGLNAIFALPLFTWNLAMKRQPFPSFSGTLDVSSIWPTSWRPKMKKWGAIFFGLWNECITSKLPTEVVLTQIILNVQSNEITAHLRQRNVQLDGYAFAIAGIVHEQFRVEIDSDERQKFGQQQEKDEANAGHGYACAYGCTMKIVREEPTEPLPS